MRGGGRVHRGSFAARPRARPLRLSPSCLRAAERNCPARGPPAPANCSRPRPPGQAAARPAPRQPLRPRPAAPPPAARPGQAGSPPPARRGGRKGRRGARGEVVRYPACSGRRDRTKMAAPLDEYEKEAGCVPLLHPEVSRSRPPWQRRGGGRQELAGPAGGAESGVAAAPSSALHSRGGGAGGGWPGAATGGGRLPPFCTAGGVSGGRGPFAVTRLPAGCLGTRKPPPPPQSPNGHRAEARAQPGAPAHSVAPRGSSSGAGRVLGDSSRPAARRRVRAWKSNKTPPLRAAAPCRAPADVPCPRAPGGPRQIPPAAAAAAASPAWRGRRVPSPLGQLAVLFSRGLDWPRASQAAASFWLSPHNQHDFPCTCFGQERGGRGPLADRPVVPLRYPGVRR